MAYYYWIYGLLLFYKMYIMKEKNMIFEFPKLTGSYKVGSMQRHIIDQNRQEPHNPPEKRELMVHLWYPADIQDENPLEVYSKAELGEAKEALRARGYQEEDIASLDTTFCHALPDAPPLSKGKPFPVVIFSHGYGAQILRYTAFCEELASHGYIVVAIEHTYYTSKTAFPDGRVIQPSQEQLITPPNANDFKIWLDDVDCVLDRIKLWNSTIADAFYGFFDITHIGMFGHSYGGMIAFEMCAYDDRIKAGIDLDAGLIGKATLSDMRKPFMFIMGCQSIANFYLSDEELAKQTGQSLEMIKEQKSNERSHNIVMREIAEKLNPTTNIPCILIPGLDHIGFSDFLIIKEMPIYKNNRQCIDLEKFIGNVDGFETMKVINEHIVKFFDKNLR